MEEWRDIPGYEGEYRVSNLGRVKSLKHSDERILATGPKPTDQSVLLSLKGVRTGMTCAQAVARAFIGPPPEGAHSVRHVNGDSLDHRPENLRWIIA